VNQGGAFHHDIYTEVLDIGVRGMLLFKQNVHIYISSKAMPGYQTKFPLKVATAANLTTMDEMTMPNRAHKSVSPVANSLNVQAECNVDRSLDRYEYSFLE